MKFHEIKNNAFYLQSLVHNKLLCIGVKQYAGQFGICVQPFAVHCEKRTMLRLF